MPNTILTPTAIARETLAQLINNCVFGNLVHRDLESNFAKAPRIGESITIRKPVKFTVTDGATLSSQDVTENSTSITIDQRKHVAFSFSSQELTMKIDEFSKRYIEPAAIQLANAIDSSIAGLYVAVPGFSGAAGTTPNTFAHLANLGKLMSKNGVPNKGRNLVLGPDAKWTLADAFKGFYQETITKEILREATLGRFAGFDCFEDQNIKVHTKGVQSGTPLVNGATQTGSTLVTDGWTISQTPIIKVGDVITIDGVYAVNPVSRETQSHLAQFTVTAAANSDGSGNATISIYPAITTSGAYQTVSGSPADNAAINVLAANHVANLAFTKEAFALAMVPLEVPKSAAWSSQESHDGFSIRFIRDYDVTNDKEIYRLDVFYGVKCIYPELAARLLG
ncbi:MAG: hypothetical protein OEV92_03945 [Nitrospinota bacterium]|nr:hypothetical protein [Nitrospinota bacterium]